MLRKNTPFMGTWNDALRVTERWLSEIDDGGFGDFIPPTCLACGQAVRIIGDCIKRDYLAPDRIVWDGDGGIVIERFSTTHSRSIEIGSDGDIECVICKKTKVVDRHEIVGEWKEWKEWNDIFVDEDKAS